VLKILHAVQGHFGYLPQEALERICKITQIAPASIEGVSSFYDHFRHRPVGRHIIHVCVGTACHVKGADRVYEAFYRHLGIAKGEDTDAQKLFTVEKIACLGCCTLAPAVQIDNVTYGHLTPDTVSTVIGDFLRYEQSQAGQKKKTQKLPADGSESRGEVRRMIENVEHATGVTTLMCGYTLEDIATGIDCYGHRQPLGVFACIPPYNFPAMVPWWFLPYALVTWEPSTSAALESTLDLSPNAGRLSGDGRFSRPSLATVPC